LKSYKQNVPPEVTVKIIQSNVERRKEDNPLMDRQSDDTQGRSFDPFKFNFNEIDLINSESI
jgi:hypothetical protein